MTKTGKRLIKASREALRMAQEHAAALKADAGINETIYDAFAKKFEEHSKIEVTMARVRTHPGRILSEALLESDITVSVFARQMGVKRDEILAILREEMRVDNTLAEKIGNHFAQTAAFWTNLQKAYDESL